MNSLVDIGVNLTHRAFRADREAVLERAWKVGVDRCIVTGTSVEESRAAAELATEHPGKLFATAGVHPHHARQCDGRTLDELRRIAGRSEVVAIGECGLDFNRDFSPRPTQVEWFEAQIRLAVDLQMPLFLHERDASERFVEILRPHRPGLVGAVVHCFTGDERALDAYLDLDLHLGITGWICDERRGRELQQLVRRIPLERMMLETDAPYLVPRTVRPKPKARRNEPALLPHVLETVAECLRLSPEEVASATSRTARKFFGIGPCTDSGPGARPPGGHA